MKKKVLFLFLILTIFIIFSSNVCALPIPDKIVNHNDIASVDSYVDDVNVRNALITQKWLFTHASVGGNMTSGMKALKNNDSRYGLGINNVYNTATSVTTSNGNIYEINRGNPGIQSKLDIFADAFNTYGWANKVNIAMNKYCYIDIRDLSGTVTVDDMPTYANQYLNSMQALETSYPGVTFVYMTVPTTTASSLGTARIYAFNQLVRNYASSNGKYLFDIADIESYDPSGVHQTSNYIDDQLEMLYSGYTTDGGHPNTALGEQRIALGWYAMAISIAYNENQVDTSPISVTGITVTPTTMDLAIGATGTITPAIAPSNATNKNITWTSSDSSVATINNGVVKALKVGKATITARTVDGDKTALTVVNVKQILVTGITVTPTTLDLAIGASGTITPTIAPSNATNKNITWTSSDSSVATVDNGVVKALKVGKATITAKTVDGNKTATVEITVKPINVTTVIIKNKDVTELKTGQTLKLEITIDPANATNKEVIWTSSNNSIATVDNNGVVRAISKGVVTITVTTKDKSKTDKININITQDPVPLTDIKIKDLKSSSLDIGDKLQLKSILEPSNATDVVYIWESSDNKIATVNQKGLVTAIKNGTVIITLKTKDGNFSNKIQLNITEKKSSVNSNIVMIGRVIAILIMISIICILIKKKKYSY